LHPAGINGNQIYHFSFLKDIKVHGIYFNSLNRFLELYCFARREHAYDFYSIILFTSGSGSIIINNDSYPVKEGTICLVAPDQVHSFMKIGNAEGHLFFFCQDYYVEEFSIIRLLNLYSYTSATARGVQKPCIDLSKNEFSTIKSAFISIENEYNANECSSAGAIIRSHLNILMLKLTSNYEALSESSSGSESVLVHSLSRLIDSYFIQEQHLGFYTSAFNISESQLNEICNKHFNCGLKKILQNRLMQEARKLLVTSDMSISEIAYKLNFEDNSYFCRVFRTKTGISPKRFRDIHKKFVPQKT
jgi:AraC family transcriptional regulator, transcriptional activator of pobA